MVQFICGLILGGVIALFIFALIYGGHDDEI